MAFLLIDISFKILDIIYTGSRLQRVRLLRPPGYNKQIIFSKKMTSDWQYCLKSSDVTSTVFNEHIFMNYAVRSKRDPVYCFSENSVSHNTTKLVIAR